MIIWILLIIILCLVYKIHSTDKKKRKIDLSMEMDIYPSDDKGYIKHMIHHHQVAVDMSEHLLKYTTDPRMIALCRDIIWVQKYEIWQMKNMLESKPYVSPLSIPRNKIYEEAPLLQKYYPKRSSYQSENDKNDHQSDNENDQSDNDDQGDNDHQSNNDHQEHFTQPSKDIYNELNLKVVDRSMFFPEDDDPKQHIENFVADGYYPNNPPLDEPLRNSNLQFRSEMPNLNTLPSHWNETTITPDVNRRPLEISDS